ncbi:MAG: four helix bundle protein [Bacillota bacterium]
MTGEDLEAWKKARELARIIYQITSAGEFSHDFSLRDQIRRAAISVMSNIAEGFECKGDKEFRHFLSIAKGSAAEVKAQIYIAKDAELISETQFADLYELTSEVGRLTSGMIKYLTKPKES